MQTAAMAETKARHLIHVCNEKAHHQPGYVMAPGALIVSMPPDWTKEELQEAVRYAVAEDWVEETSEGLRLTPAGARLS